jgi:microcystin-dependent protein
LFTAIGTTYGAGDGSTTFNVPDLGGRVVAGKEASATRLTSGVSGVDGGTLGAVGGNQNLHQHTHTATVTDPGHSHSTTVAGTISGASGAAKTVSGFDTTGSATTGITVANANAGTGSSENVQPTIVLNWLIYAGV